MNPNFFMFAIPLFVLLAVRIIKRSVSIVDISKSLPTNGKWSYRSLSNIIDITVHHSATPTNQNAFNFARYHIDSKGWKGIAYHFVIDPDGTINKTNEYTAWTYHNGYNNKNAIAICLVGNFENFNPTENQRRSLVKICKKLKSEIPSIKNLMGHKEYKFSTSCPAFDVSYLRGELSLKKRSSTNSLAINNESNNYTEYDVGKDYEDN